MNQSRATNDEAILDDAARLAERLPGFYGRVVLHVTDARLRQVDLEAKRTLRPEAGRVAKQRD